MLTKKELLNLRLTTARELFKEDLNSAELNETCLNDVCIRSIAVHFILDFAEELFDCGHAVYIYKFSTLPASKTQYQQSPYSMEVRIGWNPSIRFDEEGTKKELIYLQKQMKGLMDD